MINYIRVDARDQLEDRMKALATRMSAFWNFDQGPVMIYYEPWKDPRTRSQNNLYWMWLEEMANFYSRPMKQYDQEDMHDLMRHQFLGYDDKTIGSTTVKRQLKRTKKLSKEAMSEYMTQIEAWNTEHGLLLTIPSMNEYFKYREARQ